MENIIIKDGIEKMDFEKITEMLSKAYWSPQIKIGEKKKVLLIRPWSLELLLMEVSKLVMLE